MISRLVSFLLVIVGVSQLFSLRTRCDFFLTKIHKSKFFFGGLRSAPEKRDQLCHKNSCLIVWVGFWTAGGEAKRSDCWTLRWFWKSESRFSKFWDFLCFPGPEKAHKELQLLILWCFPSIWCLWCVQRPLNHPFKLFPEFLRLLWLFVLFAGAEQTWKYLWLTPSALIWMISANLKPLMPSKEFKLTISAVSTVSKALLGLKCLINTHK